MAGDQDPLDTHQLCKVTAENLCALGCPVPRQEVSEWALTRNTQPSLPTTPPAGQESTAVHQRCTIGGVWPWRPSSGSAHGCATLRRVHVLADIHVSMEAGPRVATPCTPRYTWPFPAQGQ